MHIFSANGNSIIQQSITWHGVWVSLTVFAVGLILAYAVGWILNKALLKIGRGPSSANVFSKLVAWVIRFAFFAAALIVVFPSVRPVDVLGGVTMISLAAGIAFQTVLGNMFAGLVILARDQFRSGDQVSIGDVSGRILEIGFTSTRIRSFEGELLVLPNQMVHDKAVQVQTGFEILRSSVELTVNANTDAIRACAVARAALDAAPLVRSEPEPEVFLRSFSGTSLVMELRFWSGARRIDTISAQHEVIVEVLKAFEKAHIDFSSNSLSVDTPPAIARGIAQDVLKQVKEAPAESAD